MSIEKFNPSFSYEETPYTQINTKVIQQITDPDCLASWVYLLSKPKDWEVIKSHLKNHFCFGDKKIKKIFAYFARVNLTETIRHRQRDGKLGKVAIMVLNGSRFNAVTTGSKNHPVVVHPSGKEGTTNKRDYKLKKDHKLERQKPKRVYTRLPSDFYLSDENQKLCLERNFDPDWLFEKFKAHAKSADWRRADWNAALAKWILTERPPKETKSPVDQPKPLTPEEKTIREENYKKLMDHVNSIPSKAEIWAKEKGLTW